MDNIPGVFKITIAGADRDAKVNFGLVERLEKQILRRPLQDLLVEAASGRSYVSDVVTVIHESLVEAGDKRMSREEVGNAIMKEGAPKFAEKYVDLLVYALTGGVPATPGTSGAADDSKKN